MSAPTVARPVKMTSSHNDRAPAEALTFLRALHHNDAGELAIFSARRSKDRLVEPRTDYFTLPNQAEAAAAHAVTEAGKGRETYACAHLLTERRRVKEAAAPVTALWADGDLGQIPAGFAPPSLRVASSPGREQWYWRLTRPITPAQAEDLNRRIAHLTGADGSGWDLGQLLRIPGTPNRKYPDAPLVRTVHAGPETYDPDDLDRLLPALPPPATTVPRTEPAPGDDGGVEPPVRLDTAGLALWRGEWFARKHDAPGEVDRSESLWRLACVLDEAGATASTIAAALAERDMTLGWEKYAGRRDAAEQYAAIVAKLAQRTRLAPPAMLRVGAQSGSPPVNPNDPALPDDPHILKAMIVDLSRQLEAAERRATVAERKAAELSLLQSRTMAAFRSKHLGNEKATGVALAHLAASQVPTRADPEGWIPVPHKRLADGAGVSDQTVPNHLEKLERGVGGFERKVEWVPASPPRIDRETGEILEEARPGRKQTFIRMTVPPAEFLERIATATPDPEKPKSGWGGRRLVAPCPKHPAANIIKRTAYVCGECGDTLGKDPDIELSDIKLEGAPCQDDGTGRAREEHPYHQDDRTSELISRPIARPIPRVDNHYRSANGPASHNVSQEAAPPGTIAAAWQAGQSLPGFDPPPRTRLDHLTDVAHGRAAPR